LFLEPRGSSAPFPCVGSAEGAGMRFPFGVGGALRDLAGEPE
jgi:hypothetical protein